MVLLLIGVAVALVGVALLLNLASSGSFVIRHLTSRSLGELAPGYAASSTGFRVYATLVLAIGIRPDEPD
ncbi:MAG: hypothetical protein JF888_07600 [Candidatus Dormibacteraeota bacterium]|uniref:Uncharacterized protein n=1 Tax=Candidatus Dormiibacter inghamiae TaxID=3127013 RepID=A0A934KAN7_9BACT|nr:hypothetical protein [Candidatus Dormibacteraeota bacterium]MBJ7606027.1 hypothetical protein [Candidatus Dormibacteraeota bacterium]